MSLWIHDLKKNENCKLHMNLKFLIILKHFLFLWEMRHFCFKITKQIVSHSVSMIFNTHTEYSYIQAHYMAFVSQRFCVMRCEVSYHIRNPYIRIICISQVEILTFCHVLQTALLSSRYGTSLFFKLFLLFFLYTYIEYTDSM